MGLASFLGGVVPAFRALFDLLASQVCAGTWWPAQSRFEIVAGAILTQNTAWTNVELALANLRRERALGADAILALPADRLAQLIRPAGYYNAKSRYLRTVSEWFLARDEAAAHLDTGRLRSELLALRGVGPETADDILLYAYNRGVFIYDLYARRLLAAAGFGEFRTYDAAKKALDAQVAGEGFSAQELALFHGLVVDASKIARKVGGWADAYPLLQVGSFPSP
ncbi:deoxyribonuclease [Actinomyces sp. HMSC06A08]|nr:deoxyribonuclease [Actinomyces sp. HMSC064C12]OFK03092.1 deoxyribonuclease [Actinomyces sp. HMSC072A03]OFT56547.1 deoxyribonuclease [Actinomyces sp. HMSC06A08]